MIGTSGSGVSASTSETDASSRIHTTGSHDIDETSQIICCMQIQELEDRMEELLIDAEEKNTMINNLQRLKRLINREGDTYSPAEGSELAELLAYAKSHGICVETTGWTNKESKEDLLEAIHSKTTQLESVNTTQYMQIQRLMSLRTEKSNLYSRLAENAHQLKQRILGRIDRR